MSVLPMAISHPKVPQVLNLSKVLDHEEVVLVLLGVSFSIFAGSSQVGERIHHIIDFFVAILLVFFFLPRLCCLHAWLILLHLLLVNLVSFLLLN